MQFSLAVISLEYLCFATCEGFVPRLYTVTSTSAFSQNFLMQWGNKFTWYQNRAYSNNILKIWDFSKKLTFVSWFLGKCIVCELS
jgi:hypothetical protein